MYPIILLKKYMFRINVSTFKNNWFHTWSCKTHNFIQTDTLMQHCLGKLNTYFYTYTYFTYTNFRSPSTGVKIF